MGVPVGLLVNRVWNGECDLQAGVEGYYWEHPQNFGSFRAAEMTPFLDPNFTSPFGQLAAPSLFAHEEPGPNFMLCTQI